VRTLLGIILTTSVLLAGCSSDPQQPPPPPVPQDPKWPQKLSDFRFSWSAEPGIDLTTGIAVPLRAYLESWRVIFYTEHLDDGYPGYTRATPELVQPWSAAWLKLPQSQREIRAFLGGGDPNERFFGNEDFHILRIEPLSTGFRAFVCDATFRVYRQPTGSTSFAPLDQQQARTPSAADTFNMSVWRIEFSDRDPRVGSALPAPPTQPQQGPLPAPRADVFGPWFVTGAVSVEFWWDADHPGLPIDSLEADQRRDEARAEEDAMRQQCLERYPAGAEVRFKLATTVLDSPPQVEPAKPGWPDVN
jgi:hypothetical protein